MKRIFTKLSTGIDIEEIKEQVIMRGGRFMEKGIKAGKVIKRSDRKRNRHTSITAPNISSKASTSTAVDRSSGRPTDIEKEEDEEEDNEESSERLENMEESEEEESSDSLESM